MFLRLSVKHPQAALVLLHSGHRSEWSHRVWPRRGVSALWWDDVELPCLWGSGNSSYAFPLSPHPDLHLISAKGSSCPPILATSWLRLPQLSTWQSPDPASLSFQRAHPICVYHGWSLLLLSSMCFNNSVDPSRLLAPFRALPIVLG